MDDAIHGTLVGWANFYLITGTAAAALTGLQFVGAPAADAAPARHQNPGPRRRRRR